MTMKTVQLAIYVVVPAIVGIISASPDVCSTSILDNAIRGVTHLILDNVHTPGFPLVQGDSSVFTEILGFNESELQDFTEQAMEYYLTRFGLDFTNSVPDASGTRTFENATLNIASNDPSFGQSFVSNADPLVSGIKLPQYHLIRIGTFMAGFTGPQILRGTYGGDTGIVAGLFPGEIILFGFYYCATCPNGPLIMPYRSITPARLEPFDGNIIFALELEHPELGRGISRGFGRMDPTDDPTLLHFQVRLPFTFRTGRRCSF